MTRRTRPTRKHLDWHPPSLAPVSLEGQRVALREWTRADSDAVRAYADDPEVGRYLIRSPAELLAEPALAIAQAEESPRTEYAFAIVAREHVARRRHLCGHRAVTRRREHVRSSRSARVASASMRPG